MISNQPYDDLEWTDLGARELARRYHEEDEMSTEQQQAQPYPQQEQAPPAAAPVPVTFTDEQMKLIAGLIDQAAAKAANAARGPVAGQKYAPRQPVPRRQVEVPAPENRKGHRPMRDGVWALPIEDGSGEFYDPGTGELYDAGGSRVGFHVELLHAAE